MSNSRKTSSREVTGALKQKMIAIRNENLDKSFLRKSFQCCMRFCDTIKAKIHLTEIIVVNLYLSASHLPMCSADVPPKCGWTCNMQTRDLYRPNSGGTTPRQTNQKIFCVAEVHKMTIVQEDGRENG